MRRKLRALRAGTAHGAFGGSSCVGRITSSQGRPIALGRPELRRVRPATTLKTGPLSTSSQARQGLRRCRQMNAPPQCHLGRQGRQSPARVRLRSLCEPTTVVVVPGPRHAPRVPLGGSSPLPRSSAVPPKLGGPPRPRTRVEARDRRPWAVRGSEAPNDGGRGGLHPVLVVVGSVVRQRSSTRASTSRIQAVATSMLRS